MKRCIVLLLTVAFVVLCTCVFSHYVNAAEQGVIKLRLSTYMPPVHPTTMLTKEFCDEIEKRTNGRVKITLYPVGTLTPPNQTYDSVTKGIVDIGHSCFSYTAGRFPLTEVIDYPFGIKSALQATGLLNAYYKKFRPKELDDTHVLVLYGCAPHFFSAKKEISKISDMKGLRFKATGVSAAMAKALGIVPVTLAISETYDALSKGLLDGVLLPNEGTKGFGFEEFVKYSMKNFGCTFTTSIYITMNKKKWESLSPDIQKIVTEVSEQWTEKYEKHWNQLDADREVALVKGGHKYTIASAEEEALARQKVKPLFDEYIQRMKKEGLPGDQAVKFCFDYLAAHPK